MGYAVPYLHCVLEIAGVNYGNAKSPTPLINHNLRELLISSAY